MGLLGSKREGRGGERQRNIDTEEEGAARVKLRWQVTDNMGGTM